MNVFVRAPPRIVHMSETKVTFFYPMFTASPDAALQTRWCDTVSKMVKTLDQSRLPKQKNKSDHT